MPEQPLVSIIIPTYNRAHLIGETLDSVLAQTYRNWECIVVDDGSIDGTKELLKTYMVRDSRIQFYKRPNTHLPGGNGARNYGFEISKGEFIQWFDDDDVMLNQFIISKLNKFKDNVCLVICSGYYADSQLANRVNTNLTIKWNLYKDYVLWQLKIVTNNVMFRRTFLVDKKLFNPQVLRGQEAEFFSRLFYEMPDAEYSLINIPLFLYRQHEGTKSTANNAYNPKFRKDQIILLIENFKRTLKLNDAEFTKRLYRGIITKFFQAIENDCSKNGYYILKKMIPIVKEINIYSGLKFYLLGCFSLSINKKSDKIKNQLLAIKLQ